MSALVHELVHMASDSVMSTTELLRRALVMARRLDIPELVDWINSELNGYKSGEVPEYRRIRGQPMAENPAGGLSTLIFPPETPEQMFEFSVRQSIPELIHLQGTTHDQVLGRYFPADLEETLTNMIQEVSDVTMRPVLKFSGVKIQGVIEAVRNQILDWALKLEGQGIIGEAMSFTPQEKQAAQELHYHFGNVSGSQIQISSNGSTQTQTNTTTGANLKDLQGLIEALAALLDRSRIAGDAADELRAELATLQAQTTSPKPKWEIIKATARSIKTIAEGAAGNLLSELAKPHVTTLMALAAGAAGS